MTHNPSFDLTRADAQIVAQIVIRATSLLGEDVMGNRLSLAMDLYATHANGCPMDFARLLSARDFDFIHDIKGIVRHMDRNTGKLTGGFTPRFARRTHK